ncbi:MAG: hypothetical protein Kow00133_13040 [Amphiplicatus sp.]
MSIGKHLAYRLASVLFVGELGSRTQGGRMRGKRRGAFSDVIVINKERSGKNGGAQPKKGCDVCRIICGIVLVGLILAFGYLLGVHFGAVEPCCEQVIACCELDFDFGNR